MEVTITQESFAAGEISPLTQGRYTSEGYKSGCKELLNMIPNSRGPVTSRDGTKFIKSFTGENGRIFSHAVSNAFFYSIILLDKKMIITGIEGAVPSVNHAANSRFVDLGAEWTAEVSDSSQTVEFTQYHCLLEVTDTPNKWARISQQITVPAAGDYTILAQTDGGEFYRVDVGTSAGDATYGTTTSADTETNLNVTVPGTTFWVTLTKDSDGGIGLVHLHFLGVGDNPSVEPEFVTPWTDVELADVHVIPVPAGGAAYFLHPFYAPRKLVYDIDTDSFTLSVPVITSPPSAWAGRNWPSVGAYFEGRLWMGATPAQPQTIWASISGGPENFTPGVGNADDAISIVMANYGRIEWIVATKNLLVGTESSEYIITSEDGVITPTDHQVEQQSSYGSTSVQAQLVGDQVFYVSPDGVKLRAMQYEWSSNNWLTTDLTYFSEHITKGKIKAVAWLQNPNNLFLNLLEDGTFAVLSYDRSNNIYGWARHDIGGKCIDISVSTIEGVDILGMLVKRKDGLIYYESYVVHDEHHYMDSWTEHYFETATASVTGLEYLEGKTVQLYVDGATHPDKVVTGGSITLDRTANTVLVGLAFTSKIKLLPIEKGAPTGSSAPYNKNYHSFDVHLLDSAHPLINGERAPVRTASTPMGTPEPVVTGKSFISLLGWKNETDITIEQDLPLAMTIVAVSGKMNQEKL